MKAGPRLDVDDVRAELRIEDVAARYGLGKRTGRTDRLKQCPSCGTTSSSTAIVIDYRRQTWGHFGRGKREGGNCYGGAIDLIAACEGLDVNRDFVKVLAIGAEIAGVEARKLSDEERAVRDAERERQRQERERRQAEEDADRLRAAMWLAAGDWHRMIRGRRNRAGGRYLRTRGLNDDELLANDHIRYDAYGNVCVPLYSFDGEIINVVRRRIGPGEAKVIGLTDCPTAGSLSGRIQDITSTSTIVTEGVIDTLTAIQRWPGRLVLGAHGAGQLPALVEAAAPRIRDAGGKLVLIPDGDDIGKRQMVRAGELALKAGLVMDKTLLVVEVTPYHDLNEAHVKGWKPS